MNSAGSAKLFNPTSSASQTTVISSVEQTEAVPVCDPAPSVARGSVAAAEENGSPILNALSSAAILLVRSGGALRPTVIPAMPMNVLCPAECCLPDRQVIAQRIQPGVVLDHQCHAEFCLHFLPATLSHPGAQLRIARQLKNTIRNCSRVARRNQIA